MGLPTPRRFEDRDPCPTCGLKVAYLPLGRYCVIDGYLWWQKVTRRWRTPMSAAEREARLRAFTEDS